MKEKQKLYLQQNRKPIVRKCWRSVCCFDNVGCVIFDLKDGRKSSDLAALTMEGSCKNKHMTKESGHSHQKADVSIPFNENLPFKGIFTKNG